MNQQKYLFHVHNLHLFCAILQNLEVNFLFNPLNAELNTICHLLALLGAHHIFHVSRIRVNLCFM